MKAMRPFIIPIIGLIAFCLIWEFIVWANEWPNYVMASPSDLGPAFYKFGWLFIEYGWDTLWRTVVGLLLAIIFGVVVGMIMGFSRAMREALYPLLVGFNAIPKATVVPVVALRISAQSSHPTGPPPTHQWHALGKGSQVQVHIYRGQGVIGVGRTGTFSGV